MIYFIQAVGGGLIKIGKADDPAKRLAEIQRHSPVMLRIVATIKGEHEKERQLHQQFAGARHHREWFAPVKELREYISQVNNGVDGHNIEYNNTSVNDAIMDRIGVHLPEGDS